MNEFRKALLKVHGHRVHKIKNSYGVRDAYNYIRNNNFLDINYNVKEQQFYYIIRHINLGLVQMLLEGHDITFPNRMGRLEVRKYKSSIKITDKGIKTNLPVDWDRTLKLWEEDEEACQNKTLVKMEEKEIFKVWYNRIRANYTNKSYYRFSVNRGLKIKLKERIKEHKFDAFEL